MLGGTGGLLLLLLLLFVVLFGGIGFHGQNPAPWSLGAVRTCCLVEPAATVLRRRGRSVDAKDWARAEDSRPARGGSELDATAELRRGGGLASEPAVVACKKQRAWCRLGGGRRRAIGEPSRDGDAHALAHAAGGAIITDPTRTANGMSADVDVSVQSPRPLCNTGVNVQGRPARTAAM